MNYYSILHVTSFATGEEIEAAYQRRRRRAAPGRELKELTRAYKTLRNPTLRREYDRERATPHTAQDAAPAGERRATRPQPLATEEASERPTFGMPRRLVPGILTLILAAFLSLLVLPRYAHKFRTYDAGARLVDQSGRDVGTVVEYRGHHAFPNGKSAPAYLVRLPDGGERWLPRDDVNLVYSQQEVP